VTSLGVVSIATGEKYRGYWFELIQSFKATSVNFGGIKFYLLTDDPDSANEFASRMGMQLEAFEIPSYGWPEATLLRYKEILKQKDHFKEDILMYLDADMLVIHEFESTLYPEFWKSGIALVAHPGYWRPSGVELLRYFLKNPLCLASDAIHFARTGGLGTWELRRQSRAFVGREARKIYVCGGTWMGKRDQFLKMVRSCSENVDEDLGRGLVAKWHDESHLNKWLSENNATVLTPSYCFDPTYANLQSLPEFIRAVRK
jgi:hypothetical protein